MSLVSVIFWKSESIHTFFLSQRPERGGGVGWRRLKWSEDVQSNVRRWKRVGEVPKWNTITVQTIQTHIFTVAHTYIEEKYILAIVFIYIFVKTKSAKVKQNVQVHMQNKYCDKQKHKKSKYGIHQLLQTQSQMDVHLALNISLQANKGSRKTPRIFYGFFVIFWRMCQKNSKMERKILWVLSGWAFLCWDEKKQISRWLRDLSPNQHSIGWSFVHTSGF